MKGPSAEEQNLRPWRIAGKKMGALHPAGVGTRMARAAGLPELPGGVVLTGIERGVERCDCGGSGMPASVHRHLMGGGASRIQLGLETVNPIVDGIAMPANFEAAGVLVSCDQLVPLRRVGRSHHERKTVEANR